MPKLWETLNIFYYYSVFMVCRHHSPALSKFLLTLHTAFKIGTSGLAWAIQVPKVVNTNVAYLSGSQSNKQRPSSINFWARLRNFGIDNSQSDDVSGSGRTSTAAPSCF